MRTMRVSIKRRLGARAVAVLVVLVVLALAGARAEDPQPVALYGLDVLAQPGQRLRLRARLRAGELFGLARDIPRAPVSYFLNDDLLATVMTNRSGRAALERIVPKAEDHVIRLFYPGGEEYASAESYLRLFVRKPNASFLVTDIDFTLAQTESLLALRSGRVALKAQPRAAFVLRRLVTERGMTILYITAREESLINLTREWLSDQGFPPGPLFAWDYLHSPLSHEAYKQQLLSRLKKEWPGIEWAVGDRLEDVRAYQACGIKPIWLPSIPPEQAPEGTFIVQSWRDIENVFFPFVAELGK